MKRKLIGIIVSMLLIATIFQVAADQPDDSYNEGLSEDDEWYMFRHDPIHTGYSTSTAPRTNHTLWANITSPGLCPFSSQVQSSPAIKNGHVYIASLNTNIYCLNASTGTIIWTYQTDNSISSSPVVANGYVYVGSDDNMVYCLDAIGNGDGTTTEIWNYSTYGNVRSSPAVIDGKIYIGSNDGDIYSLDSLNGDLIWNYTTGGQVKSSPAIANGYVYVGSDDNMVYCLDAIGNGDGTTTEIWSYPANGSLLSSPAIANGFVYIASTNGIVYCINALDGILEWEFRIGVKIGSSPAVADGRVYIGETISGIYCLDAEGNGDGTTDIIWSYIVGIYIGCDSSPAVADGKIFIGSYDGNLYAFEDLNNPPENPVILSGPNAGGPEISHNFTFSSIDPEGDQVYCMWDWGNGNTSEWLGPYNSGENISTTYVWDSDGEFEIRVRVKDETMESDWSEPHNISISKQIDLSNIKPGFIYFRLLSFDKSYAYIYILEMLGVSVVVGSYGVNIEAEATEAVDSVTFEAFSPIWGDYISKEDNDGSDDFSDQLNLSTGLWELTTYAYDADGNMIDINRIDYFLFIGVGSSEAQIGQTGILRQRVRNRLTNRESPLI